jgi:hypothetical protein
MFYLVMEDCGSLKKGHHIGMSEKSAKEPKIVKLISDGIIKELTPEESNKIYREQQGGSNGDNL